MKKRIFLTAIGLLVLLLAACGEGADSVPHIAPSTVPTAAPPQHTEAPTTPPTQPPEPVTVWPGAVEDYLLPLEEFSWERIAAPEYVMLHFTSAVVPHPEDPFHMDYIRQIFVEYDLSVHYIVDRDGTVHCYIPEDRVAWHAGAGSWKGEEKYENDMNQYAIGIELVAIGSQADMADYLTPEDYQAMDDSLKGFTPEQYAALRLLVADICSRNGIPMDRSHVIGHQEYNPGKNDPGELFDWSQLFPEARGRNDGDFYGGY